MVGVDGCPPLQEKQLLSDDRGELFHPAIIGHAIGLTVAAIGNRCLPEEDLVKVIETVDLAALGSQ